LRIHGLLKRLTLALVASLIPASWSSPTLAQDEEPSPQDIIKVTGAVIEWHWCHRIVYQFVALDGQVVYVNAMNEDPKVREVIALAISQGLIKARITMDKCPMETTA
jgi:hypothetical protein